MADYDQVQAAVVPVGRNLLDGYTQNLALEQIVGDSGGGDTTPPIVTLLSPPNMSELSPASEIRIRVTDNVALRRTMLIVAYGGSVFVVHDGDRFRAGFSGTRETVVGVGQGYDYTIRRVGGWHYTATFEVIAIDTSGNEAP